MELKRVAIMAQDGMARAIRPLHSPFDGDVVFALSTGQREVQGSRELAVLQIGALAADTARAIARGVHAAVGAAAVATGNARRLTRRHKRALAPLIMINPRRLNAGGFRI
ncbi:P1 family peptidase [Serratia ureilytica]